MKKMLQLLSSLLALFSCFTILFAPTIMLKAWIEHQGLKDSIQKVFSLEAKQATEKHVRVQNNFMFVVDIQSSLVAVTVACKILRGHSKILRHHSNEMIMDAQLSTFWGTSGNVEILRDDTQMGLSIKPDESQNCWQ